MKKFLTLLPVVLCLFMLVGCVGTPVIYHSDCDCPTNSTNNNTDVPTVTGELKTGIAITTGIGESKDATTDKNGEGKYDVTMVAVLVDNDGIIRDCIIDGIATSVKFDAAGQITTDLTAAPATKNELGDKYGMVAYGGAKAEWYKQADALAKFAIGKTVKQLRDGAIDETGKAPAGSDLASSATIYLGGYVSAIEKAVANATTLGANGGDSLHMATETAINGSKNATASDAGITQLEATVAVMTMKDGKITSCVIDAVQAKINFDSTGKITSDLTAEPKTKNELGDKYGMVAYGGAIAEWDKQVASFARYIIGKTPEQVANIAVNERTVPTEVDLTSSVTIAIGNFKTLIGKAAAK